MMGKVPDRDTDDRLAKLEAKYRPAWSRPDESTLRMARAIRDEIQDAERCGRFAPDREKRRA